MNNPDLMFLVDSLVTVKSRKAMYDFLLGILTPRELDEISMRLKIVRLLKKGIPQQKIAKKLKVGIATVTRGSKELARGRFKNI